LNFTGKNNIIAFCATLWKTYGVTYTVHLWLVGKHMIDFLLVLIDVFRQFSRFRRYEWILVEIVVFDRRVGQFKSKFQEKGKVVHQKLFTSESM